MALGQHLHFGEGSGMWLPIFALWHLEAMHDPVRVLVLPLLEMALYLSWIEGLEHVRLWLEVVVELSDVLDVVVDRLGPLLLQGGCRSTHLGQAQEVLQLSTLQRVRVRNEALDLLGLQLLQIIFRLINHGGIKLLFVVGHSGA